MSVRVSFLITETGLPLLCAVDVADVEGEHDGGITEEFRRFGEEDDQGDP